MASIHLTETMFRQATRTVQLAMQAPGVLSTHEADTLYLVVDRGIDDGCQAVTTNEEWAVITTAHDDLVRHLSQEVPA
ncbi:MAG: hypothetical protein JF615_17075 [Asticcacaulis sp.]|nr:hypothetical protein [Asticcacaulis sp.]